MSSQNIKKYVIIDSNAIIHRAFHALPPFTAPDGSPTGAVYGFTSILLKIIKDLKPDFIIAAFDTKAPTFRHIAFERYKAQREKAPDELYSQFPKVKKVLNAFQIPIIEKDGFEADDIIGTLAKKITSKKGPEVVIVTGDLDTLQLVDKNILVFTMRKGVSDTVLYDEKAVAERFGFPPKNLIDYKALRGDPSDNIPGVKGIGEKTGQSLIQKYGSIEKIYELMDKNKLDESQSLIEKLKNSKNEAFLSKELVTIKKDIDIDVPADGTVSAAVGLTDEIKNVFEKFGFKSLLSRFANDTPTETGPKKTPKGDELKQGAQQVLFASNPEKDGDTRQSEKAGDIAAAFRSGTATILYDEANDFILILSQGKMLKTKPADLKTLGQEDIRAINSCEKIIFDAKPLIKKFSSLGLAIDRNFFDLKIAAVLLSVADSDATPQKIVSSYLKKDAGEKAEDWFARYFEIKDAFAKKLHEEESWFVFSKIELPLTPILVKMEKIGIKIDEKHLDAVNNSFQEKIDELTEKIYGCADQKFNINSPQQLSEILFTKLRLGKDKKRIKRTSGGKLSTDQEQLADLINEHPIIRHIIEYREITKLKTTYSDTLPALMDKNGRIHTTYDQTGTVTGRLSSRNPNLQNIPVKTPLGKEIRKAFVAENGFMLASFDYSQLELRIAAEISGDPKMIEAFSREEDIHKITASEIYGVPVDKVAPEMRREAKTLNFGILYGMSARSFAKSSGLSEADAKKFYDRYFEKFAGIRKYVQDTINFAKANGYVKTHFGRRRFIPEILGSGFRAEKEAERMAINFPIQGTATGDIIKLAMIRISDLIRTKYDEKDAKMLLQIHDELLFEIADKKEFIDSAVHSIKSAMENVWNGKVKLTVDAKIGKNWAELA